MRGCRVVLPSGEYLPKPLLSNGDVYKICQLEFPADVHKHFIRESVGHTTSVLEINNK